MPKDWNRCEQSEQREGLSTEKATLLHKGSPLTDSKFKLSYNDDGGKYYYLKMYGEVHHLNYQFRTVEHIGESTYNLLQDGQVAGLYLNDIQNYPLLHKALVTLSKTT